MAWTGTAQWGVAMGSGVQIDQDHDTLECLSASALDRALELRDQIGVLVGDRRSFLARSGRDPALYLPRGSAGGDGLQMAFHTVMQGDQHVLTHPRLLRQIFTGSRDAEDVTADVKTMGLLTDSGRVGELRQRAGRGARPRVLEIGSGHGGLAYHLKKLVPGLRYVCVDRPEALLFSSICLTARFEGEDNVLITPQTRHLLATDSPGFTFLPDYLFDDSPLTGASFDLVLAVQSLPALSEAQVRHYAAGIARLLGPQGTLFEQDDGVPSGNEPRSVLAAHLPWYLPLDGAVVPRERETARLWATHPVGPYPWREAARDLRRPLGLGGRVLRWLGLRR